VEGAGEGISVRSHCWLSLAVVMLYFQEMEEIISGFSLSDLGDPVSA
jgi:hypothetical protein